MGKHMKKPAAKGQAKGKAKKDRSWAKQNKVDAVKEKPVVQVKFSLRKFIAGCMQHLGISVPASTSPVRMATTHSGLLSFNLNK